MQDAWWPRVVGLLVQVLGALSLVAEPGGALHRIAGNGYALAGSAALLLTFVEPLHRYRGSLPVGERRFRFAFVAVYAVLVAVAVLGLSGAADDPVAAYRIGLVKGACAVTGLVAGAAAVWFRLRHPLQEEKPATNRRAPTADDQRLAERLIGLLRDNATYTEANLKIGDLAQRLGQPEHKVSQCITAALGFPNFNRLINHHRIAAAKRLLADPRQLRRSILQIAFDCGFSSIGPFNRAFKDEVGQTPRAYRDALRSGTSSA